MHPIASATFASRNPVALAAAVLDDLARRAPGSALHRRIKPAAVVGFGGYPTLPPLYAATRRKVPTLIHEQNAVMGRANKALAARVDAIAGGFLDPAESKMLAKRSSSPAIRSGRAVLEAAKTPYGRPRPASRSGCWCSAAARARSSSPRPFRRRSRLLPEDQRKRLEVTQQARADDVAG